MIDIPSLIIGNPENRRVTLFQKALHDKGLPEAQVIPYLSLLNGETSICEILKPHSLIRIESPGENFDVEKRIIALGEDAENPLDTEAINFQERYGEILNPTHWFLGFKRFMSSILSDVETCSDTHVWFNHPEDIVTMFDKSKTKKILQNSGIKTSSIHRSIHSYDEFRHFVDEQKSSRFFIKLNGSSSASGIVAYEYNRRRNIEQAYSTIEFEKCHGEYRYFNSLKIRKYSDRNSIENILNYLFSHGALIEKWIPKSTYEKMAFDLRILAVDSEACQKIGRLSKSPMTNLHLGNRRVAPDELDISENMWEAVNQSVKNSMDLFPRSLYAGLDVIIPKGGKTPVILEMNAFGDLLPNIFFKDKESYGTEIDSLLKRISR